MRLLTSFRPNEEARGAHGPFGWLLALVCAFSCLLAVAWTFTTPLLQQNDELAQLDYAFGLQDAGFGAHLVGTSRSVATAQGRYLVDALSYRELKYSFRSKAPVAYGSREFVRRVDSAAPKTTVLDPRDGLPYVGAVYPKPYYVMIAQVMALRAALFGQGLYEDAVVARLVGCLFLTATLLCVYAGLRELQLQKLTAILATAAAGSLPIVSVVFSSVQPDIATIMFVTAAIAVALRATGARGTARDFVVLTALVILVAFVKPYYAATLAISLVPISALRLWRGRGESIRNLLLADGAIAVAIYAARNMLLFSPETSVHVAFPNDIVAASAHSLEDIYGAGPAFAGFWYKQGVWLSRPLVSGAALHVLKATIVAVEAIVVSLLAIAAYRTIRAWVVRGLRLQGFFEAHAQPIVLLAVYLAWTGFLVTADVSMNNTLGLLGRYWIAMILPLLAGLLYYAPATLARVHADRWRLISSCVFLCFTLFLAERAYASEYQRFYGNAAGIDAEDKFIYVTSVRVGNADCNCFDPAVRRGVPIMIGGWGLDSDAGLPGRGAYLTIDGRTRVRMYYGPPRGSEVVSPLFDDAMRAIAFEGRIDTKKLSYGKHTVAVYIEDARDGGSKMWSRRLVLSVRAT